MDPITILVIVITLAVLLFAPIRDGIETLIRWIGLLTGTSGNLIWGVYIRLRRYLRPILITLGAFLALWFVTILSIGGYAHEISWAMVLFITSTLWIVTYFLRPLSRIWGVGGTFGRVFSIIRLIAIPLTCIGGFWILLGVFSPELKFSVEKNFSTRKLAGAGSIDRSSLQNEIAYLNEDSAIYNGAGKKFIDLTKGTRVRIIGLKKSGDTNSEHLTQVMLANPEGDFIRGYEGWIPTRKLSKLEKPEEKIARVESGDFFPSLKDGIFGLFSRPSAKAEEKETVKAFCSPYEVTTEEAKDPRNQNQLPSKRQLNVPDPLGWMVVAETDYSFNEWDRTNYGWKKWILGELPVGQYRITVTGERYQGLFRQVGNDWVEVFWKMTGKGAVGINYDCCKNTFPLPDEVPMAVIAKINGKVIAVGDYTEFPMEDGLAQIYVSTNIGQDRAPGGNPAMNFLNNRGTLRVALEYRAS